MNLSKLFPNSLEANIDKLHDLYMSSTQRKAMNEIIELARKSVSDARPITVELVSHHHTGNHYVKLSRGGSFMIIASGQDRGWAQNRCAMAKHVLLGHPAPKF
ncbi:hypothetical protein C121_38 [Stenotrophomonas phage C121]|uniref:hypothetical protein n=1 Tax=Stenotrophomonas phage C121 TaxID=2914029 RepID=UPI002329837A|nr:hypothetical protein PP752_gp38 [Stenotrophomonas phage C121]UKL14771.1 hypothetical protein C121_38 [Stenotrophomonas phage C121]